MGSSASSSSAVGRIRWEERKPKRRLTRQQFDEEDRWLAQMRRVHKTTEVRKTSHEWYASMPVHRLSDPDGWRDLPIAVQSDYWFTVPIPWREFVRRYEQCTLTDDSRNVWPYGQSPP